MKKKTSRITSHKNWITYNYCLGTIFLFIHVIRFSLSLLHLLKTIILDCVGTSMNLYSLSLSNIKA